MPNRILSALSAAVLAGTLLCGAAPAMVPTLPAPPPGNSQAASMIFDAMLAIARSITVNAKGAQAATFPYTAAIQQYNAGDLTAARRSAAQAIVDAATVPLPQNSLGPPAIPQPPVHQMVQITNDPQADAEEYLALAWRTLSGGCGDLTANPGLQQLTVYRTAVSDYAGQRYPVVIREVQAIVAACAPAVAQTSAQPTASAPAGITVPEMPGELETVPTPGPDPALAPRSPQP